MSILRRPPIWLTLLLSFAGYLLISFWFPLRPYFNTIPQFDIRAFTPSLLAAFAYGCLLCALFWLYAQVAAAQIGSIWRLLGLALLLALPLLATYPINATDLYRYVARGRISSVYGQSPFETPPGAFPDDLLTPLAGEWAQETSPYGPVWELVATAVTAISGENLLLGLLLFKGVALAAHLASGWLIWQMAAGARRAAWLWLGNPALLLTFVVNGHNDALLLCWLLLALWLAQRQRPLAAWVAALLAMLTKPIGLLALPFLLIALWRRDEPRWRLVLLAVGSVLLTGLAFLPFGSPLPLALRLLREASDGAGFTPAALLMLLMQALGWVTPLTVVVRLLPVAFAGWALWLLWLAVNGRWLARSLTDIFVGYLAQALNFRIWYASWLLPFALLDDAENGRWRRSVCIWFLLTAQLSVLIYGHVRVYALAGSQLWAHLIGVPFTFGLPFLLARRWRW